jgi:hypothetical protein
LSIVVCASAVFFGKPVLNRQNILLFGVIIILILQTTWLLPALDTRAMLHIENKPVPHSNLHFLFVGGEVLKVAGLFVIAVSLFKQQKLTS